MILEKLLTVEGQGGPAGSVGDVSRRYCHPDTPYHRLRSTQDVSNLLADTINRVLRGELDPKVANSIGYLASVILRSVEQGGTEERAAAVAVTGGAYRERLKSMWLLRKEKEMISDFEAEAAAATKSLTHGRGE